MDNDFADMDFDNFDDFDDGLLEELLKDDLDVADPIIVPDSPAPAQTLKPASSQAK
ncbi:hypothetical protein IW150_007740, partial [Coemansia sp. RSA 2607]